MSTMMGQEKQVRLMTAVDQTKANRLAYKDMATWQYVLGTLSLYAVIIVGAIEIYDISTIFDFAAAIAISALAFVFPGWFYLQAEKKFKTTKDATFRCSAYFFLCLGLFNFILGMSVNIYNIS